MLLNANSSFAYNPEAKIERSRFEIPSNHKTTFNAGSLIPLEYWEILPGDTVSMDMSSVIRMSTPLFPVMDNAYFDFYFFFVPNRIVWDHWKEFMGENTDTYWTQPVEYQVPSLYFPTSTPEAPSGGFSPLSVADYIGIPPNESPLVKTDFSLNALPFRSYVKIWNEWFRDQNVMTPAFCPTDDTSVDGVRVVDGEYDPNSAYKGGNLLPVARFHDYFSSSLPQPQKGDPVTVTVAQGGLAPVVTTEEAQFNPIGEPAINFEGTDSSLTAPFGYVGLNSSGDLRYMGSGSSMPTGTATIAPTNLAARLEGAALITINELRQAFQIQKLLERDARGGSRYRELIYSHFAIETPDASMQIPEYLGGSRVPITVDQVISTSESNGVPQGNASGWSLTSDVESVFTKSFTEHGILMAVGCVRTYHTYQQGIAKYFNKKRRFDYYFPVFDSLGEVPIRNSEIYFSRDSDYNGVFGYQEYAADYRYKPSRISASFRSGYPGGSLDSWHYADYYDEQPYLNMSWMCESPVNIDRTLAVPSSTEPQFIADFMWKADFVRPMSLRSIPGLIDHH